METDSERREGNTYEQKEREERGDEYQEREGKTSRSTAAGEMTAADRVRESKSAET